MSVRKSGRQRIPSRKVAETENGFQQMNELLANDDSEEENGFAKGEVIDKSDFDLPVEVVADGQDQKSTDSDPALDSSDGSDTTTLTEEHGTSHMEASYQSAAPLSPQPARRNHPSTKDPSIRSRGLTERHFKNRKDRITLLAGPDQADKYVLEKSRRQWINDYCLPWRKGMQHAFGHPEEERMREAQDGWTWYYEEGGKEELAKSQIIHALSAEERCKYIAGASQDVFMGPYGNQKLFELNHLQSLPLDLPLQETPTDAVTAELDSNQQSSHKKKRHGWMLNVGIRVQCLDWAPNCMDDIQYLALASSQASRNFIKMRSNTAPAFFPAASTPSSIQIWAFDTREYSEIRPDLDKGTTPKLLQVLCSEWGDAKQLKWCPMPRDDQTGADASKGFVGLLAGFWGDG